jgi:hypothetical protein
VNIVATATTTLIDKTTSLTPAPIQIVELFKQGREHVRMAEKGVKPTQEY